MNDRKLERVRKNNDGTITEQAWSINGVPHRNVIDDDGWVDATAEDVVQAEMINNEGISSQDEVDAQAHKIKKDIKSLKGQIIRAEKEITKGNTTGLEVRTLFILFRKLESLGVSL